MEYRSMLSVHGRGSRSSLLFERELRPKRRGGELQEDM